MAVAFATGIVTGYLIELFCKEAPIKKAAPAPQSFGGMAFAPQQNTAPVNLQEKPLMAAAPAKSKKPCCCSQNEAKRSPMEGLRYAFITLPSDLASALILGLVLAGLITTLLPTDLLSGSFSTGPLAFLLATAISLPLYVCATASIPMAYALIAAGLSPGAALVFLIAGPATNTATIVTVWKMLGRSATVIYLLSLLLISWLSGWLFNTILLNKAEAETMHVHGSMHPELWQHIGGILLIALLIYSVWNAKQSSENSCCEN